MRVLVGKLCLKSKHRLCCGNSTDIVAVSNAMDGQCAQLLFTSPPYLNLRDYEGNLSQDWTGLMNDVFDTAGQILSDNASGKSAQVFVNLGLTHKDNEWLPYWDDWIQHMREIGWRRFGWYVWDKLTARPGDWNGRLAPAFEFIFHFNKEARKAKHTIEKKAENIRSGPRGIKQCRQKDGSLKPIYSPDASLNTHKIPDSVIRMHNSSIQHEWQDHPAMYPVSLPELFIETYTNADDIVYEPFCGSGTTIIAAHKQNRRCYAVEMEPKYCDVAIRRFAEWSGTEAVRESDGATWMEACGHE
jgi:DNA modification methylase